MFLLNRHLIEEENRRNTPDSKGLLLSLIWIRGILGQLFTILASGPGIGIGTKTRKNGMKDSYVNLIHP